MLELANSNKAFWSRWGIQIMYISKLVIRNFRLFDDVGVTIRFHKGVNAIIGENNCGKTAIIDAMRIMFSTLQYRRDAYFTLADFHVALDGKRCNESQFDVYFDEVDAAFFEI
jgi:putative ATP-dependent endonuclease of OLD family